MAQWYCFLNNETQGPYDEDELIAIPDIVPSTKVCPVGCEEWEALADMEDLYRAYKTTRGQKKKRKKVAVECEFHPGVLAVVECKFCQKNLCEDCADKEDEYIICRNCQSRRKELLQQRADERARIKEEKRLADAKEAAARKQGRLIKRIFIGVSIIVALAVLAYAGKRGWAVYQAYQDRESTRTEVE